MYPDPDVIEQNMLDALRTRYKDLGQPELLALIEQRRARKPFAGLRTPFEQWLQNLAQVPLGEDIRQVLFDDLRSSLQGFGEASAEFVCI